jgi:hypothetical protein
LTAQAVVQRRQDSCTLEHQVCGVFNLANAPVVALTSWGSPGSHLVLMMGNGITCLAPT